MTPTQFRHVVKGSSVPAFYAGPDGDVVNHDAFDEIFEVETSAVIHSECTLTILL